MADTGYSRNYYILLHWGMGYVLLSQSITSRLVLTLSAIGHSQAPGPLNYLSLIENPTIQTPSHRVHSHSRFDLVFNLHRKKQKIKLVLEPSDGVVADGATVSYLGPDGEVARTEPLSRHDHKVFRGNAWVE